MFLLQGRNRKALRVGVIKYLKTMKSKINLQIAMLFISVFMGANTFAQGLYINAGAGYGFPAACYLMEENNNRSYDGESSVNNWEIVKGSGSFGKGIQPGIIIGYMFNQNLGAELGISYLLGGKIVSTDEYHSVPYTWIEETTMSAKMLRFTPALKMTVGNGKIKAYMRAGLIIGAAGRIKSEYKYTSSSSYIEEGEAETTGDISLGFSGALGTDFMLSDNIGIFAEMGIITQSWAPKKSEITKFTMDGQDALDNLTTNDREVEFVESYSFDSNNIDMDSPTQQLKMFFPFSSFGINVGLRIALGGSSAAKE
jgi:hypothetical protein